MIGAARSLGGIQPPRACAAVMPYCSKLHQSNNNPSAPKCLPSLQLAFSTALSTDFVDKPNAPKGAGREGGIKAPGAARPECTIAVKLVS